MRLSLVLPCYNVSRFIDGCLDSILNQDIDLTEYEVICVNDCSTDDTNDHLLEYQNKYENIIVEQHSVNQGSAGARNTGLRLASGDYVWFVDPDDYLVDHCFARLLSRAEANNLDIALFNNYVIDYEEVNPRIEHNRYCDTDVRSGCEFLSEHDGKDLSKNSIVWLQLYKRSFLESIGAQYPLVRLNDDALFSWKTLLQASRVQASSDFLYVFRANPFSITGSKPTAQKTFAKCVQGPVELESWLDESFVNDDYKHEIIKIIDVYSSSLFKEYLQLDHCEQSRLFQLLRRDYSGRRLIRRHLGKKAKIVLSTIPFGKRVFDYSVNSFLQ